MWKVYVEVRWLKGPTSPNPSLFWFVFMFFFGYFLVFFVLCCQEARKRPASCNFIGLCLFIPNPLSSNVFFLALSSSSSSFSSDCSYFSSDCSYLSSSCYSSSLLSLSIFQFLSCPSSFSSFPFFILNISFFLGFLLSCFLAFLLYFQIPSSNLLCLNSCSFIFRLFCCCCCCCCFRVFASCLLFLKTPSLVQLKGCNKRCFWTAPCFKHVKS